MSQRSANSVSLSLLCVRLRVQLEVRAHVVLVNFFRLTAIESRGLIVCRNSSPLSRVYSVISFCARIYSDAFYKSASRFICVE